MNAIDESVLPRSAPLGARPNGLLLLAQLELLERSLELRVSRPRGDKPNEELASMIGAACCDLRSAIVALRSAMQGARGVEAVGADPRRAHKAWVHFEAVTRYAQTTYARIRVEAEVIDLLTSVESRRGADEVREARSAALAHDDDRALDFPRAVSS